MSTELHRIRIKMCGVTRAVDARVAVQAGVDALGFIFHEKSSRYITPEEVRQIIEFLPPFVDTIGVFVNKKKKEVEEIIRYCNLNYAQLHGEESPKYCERLARFAVPCRVIKAFRVNAQLQAVDIAPYNQHVTGYLLDTYHKQVKGGTGKNFDWSLIARLQLQRPLLLAGGLNTTNIQEALQLVQPYGVDVNSGVEKQPGIKDHELIRTFIGLVRAFERGKKTGR